MTLASRPPPRLFGIVAAAAPVAAVLARTAGGWWHICRWELDTQRLEHGAWFRGMLYPQRCDLSPDGKWLIYFALKYPGRWAAGPTYSAVSRLPWLEVVAAWRESGTWTRGYRALGDRSRWDPGPPTVGDANEPRASFGLAARVARQFAVELDHGFTELGGSAPRSENDVWDERREAMIEKARPGARGIRLTVTGRYFGFRGLPNVFDPSRSCYSLIDGGRSRRLDGVVWADWDAAGRLLVATRTGHLELRDGDGERVLASHDLSALRPAPRPAPPATEPARSRAKRARRSR